LIERGQLAKGGPSLFVADSRHNLPQAPGPSGAERWVKVGLGAGSLLIVAWLYFSSSGTRAPVENSPPQTTSIPARTPGRESRESRADEDSDAGSGRRVEPPRSDNNPANDDSLLVHNARVTDEDGRVIHRGDVDLRPTIQRIERGKLLRFSHDGSVFENRERRLPIKPSGYYREFIHPTPDDDGLGGQRVVIGREGEVFYTPDHYKTFRRVR